MTHVLNNTSIKHNQQTIAFYNLENLFDAVDDTLTYDNDFLAAAVKKWTPKRYRDKLEKLGFAISNIGRKETGKHPALVGLAEVENAKVIADLLASKHLKEYNYNYVHYNSPDERGIDVALIYDTDAFEVLHSETFAVALFDNAGLPDYTRDILLVSGLLDGEPIHVIVNHWSSRREGEKETAHKRMALSHRVGEIISLLRSQDKAAKIMVIGDFNDDPHSPSIKQLVNNYNLFNPMETLRSYNRGTTKHHWQWHLFDQILISTNFFKTSSRLFEFRSADIFDADFLKLPKGKYKGVPFRTYVGKRYQGGYSDHFPVYVIFKR